MQDLIDRLGAELSTAPEPTFRIPDAVGAGRRAVRRRRLAAGTAALAIAVAVGSAAWVVAPGGDGSSRGRAAVDPPSSATPTPTADAGPPWGPDEVLRTNGAGRVTLNPAAEVIERHSFLEGGEAYHVALGDEEYYALASVDDSTSTQRLPAQGLGLVEWANAQSVLGSGDGGEGPGGGGFDGNSVDWVRIDSASRLTATDGTRIVEQRPDPGLGESFAAPGEPTAVAEVVVDGTTYFLAVRSIDGTTDAIPYRRDDVVSTLDGFVSFSRERYATNDAGGSEGLR